MICVVPLTISRGIADGVNLDHVVNVVALDLPGNAGERHEIVGHDDDAIGIDGIGERKSQRTACRPSVRAIGVAEEVRCGRGDHGDVNVDFAILHRLPASTVRAQHSQAAHVSVRAIVAERPIHAAFDVMHRARLHQVDHRLVTRKRCAGKPDEVLGAHARGGLQRGERDPVSIAQMVMTADGHAITQPAETQRGFQVGHALVAVCGIVAAAANRRAGFVSRGTMLIDSFVWHLLRGR